MTLSRASESELEAPVLGSCGWTWGISRSVGLMKHSFDWINKYMGPKASVWNCGHVVKTRRLWGLAGGDLHGF